MSALSQFLDQSFQAQPVCFRNVPQAAEASQAAADTCRAVPQEYLSHVARLAQDLSHTDLGEYRLLIHARPA